MKKTKKYYSRKFLNKGQGTAFIECSSEVSNWCLTTDIKIADCTRSINLDFSIYSDKEYKEKLAKIDLLLSEITKAREFIIDNFDDYKEIRNKVKKGLINPVEVVSE